MGGRAACELGQAHDTWDVHAVPVAPRRVRSAWRSAAGLRRHPAIAKGSWAGETDDRVAGRLAATRGGRRGTGGRA